MSVKRPIYICVAGTPASGKTTAVKVIAQAYPEVIVHKEINPFLFVKGHLGGAFVDEEVERKILAVSLRRIKAMAKKPGIHLDETGPFHAAFAEIVAPKMAWAFRKQYLKVLVPQSGIPLRGRELQAGIIFLQTRPEVSWQRRRDYYQQRVKTEIKKQNLSGKQALTFRTKMLAIYKRRIEEAYKKFLKLYIELRLPKTKVLNNGKDVRRFEDRVCRAFLELTKEMRINPSLLISKRMLNDQ